MSTKIKHARGPEANAPTLLEGELYFCTDTKKWIVGTVGGNEFLPYTDETYVDTKAEAILTSPLKGMRFGSYGSATVMSIFFSNFGIPSDFTRMIANGSGITYRCFHYTAEIEFEYHQVTSSDQLSFYNVNTGVLLNTFPLQDGINIIKIEWNDIGNQTSAITDFELVISINNSADYTQFGYFDGAYACGFFGSNINRGTEISNVWIQNVVFLE